MILLRQPQASSLLLVIRSVHLKRRWLLVRNGSKMREREVIVASKAETPCNTPPRARPTGTSSKNSLNGFGSLLESSFDQSVRVNNQHQRSSVHSIGWSILQLLRQGLGHCAYLTAYLSYCWEDKELSLD